MPDFTPNTTEELDNLDLGIEELEPILGSASVVELPEAFLAEASALCRDHDVGAIEGRGLMLGVRLVRSRDPWVPGGFETVLATIRQCARAGLLVHPAPAGFSLFPPLVLDEPDVDRIVATLDDDLSRLRMG